MEKDFDLKKDPRYQTAHLREKVANKTKSIYDSAEEVKEPQGKVLPKRAPKDMKRNKSDW